MDCKTARLLFDFARPGSHELEQSELRALESHLAGCIECDALARSERLLDNHLGQAMLKVETPPKLRERIVNRLMTERQALRRHRLAWTARIAAAAALLIVSVSIWAYLRPTRLPELDHHQLISGNMSQMGANRDRVLSWLEENKQPVAAPSDFNYHLLSYYGLVDHGKQKLPVLVFTRDGQRAVVYIVSQKRFNLDALLRDPPLDTGGLSVQVRDDPEDSDIRYLVFYTGDLLRRFLVDDQQPLRVS